MKNNIKYLFNKIKREKLLAKLTNINFQLLYTRKNSDFGGYKYYLNKKSKLLSKFYKDLAYAEEAIMDEISNITKKGQLSSQDIEDLNNLNNFNSDLATFIDIFLATSRSENKGKVINIFKDYDYKNLEYEFASDLYVNFKGFKDLNEDLSYLWYRSALVKHDMPLFMTKELHEQYLNYIKEKTGEEPINYNSCTTFPELREVYPGLNYNKEKELYEAVFPEFGFKYEDREEETIPVYTLDWGDKYW